MKKLAVGPKVGRKFRLDLRGSVEHNIACVAAALDKAIKHVTVCVLDRPRHDDLVAKLRELGCRIRLISDCDVTACIATCVPDSGIDIYLSVGGAPEAVISAAAMKCLGGYFQAQLADGNGNLLDEKIYEAHDLVQGDAMFCAHRHHRRQAAQGRAIHQRRAGDPFDRHAHRKQHDAADRHQPRELKCRRSNARMSKE